MISVPPIRNSKHEIRNKHDILIEEVSNRMLRISDFSASRLIPKSEPAPLLKAKPRERGDAPACSILGHLSKKFRKGKSGIGPSPSGLLEQFSRPVGTSHQRSGGNGSESPFIGFFLKPVEFVRRHVAHSRLMFV
jgi:hypothetical protein